MLLALERAFVHVVAIVQAQTEDLPGARHREPELELVERSPRARRRTEREPLELRQATGAEDLTQIAGSGRVDRGQVDDNVAFDNPEPRAVLPDEANDAHDRLRDAQRGAVVDTRAFRCAYVDSPLSIEHGLTAAPESPMGQKRLDHGTTPVNPIAAAM
jgi:hypothetical protein